MSVANKVRGEFPIELAGTTYVLRCDYEAFAAIDDQLGSIVDVAMRATLNNSLSAKEMAVIVCEGMKATGRKEGNKLADAYTARKVGELIFQTGVHNCVLPVLQFLVASLNGGTIREGNGEAEPTNPET
jgi:hypothetical protein